MKKFLILFTIILQFLPIFVFAQTSGSPGLDYSGSLLRQTAEEAGYPKDQYNIPIAAVIALIIKYLLGFLGVIFLILAIYGGVTWMTAQGNEELVAKAKRILNNAFIGILLVALAWFITWFVVTVVFEAVTPGPTPPAP